MPSNTKRQAKKTRRGAKPKPESTARTEHLGVRLTTVERARVANVARRFAEDLSESTVVRLALMRGLDLIEREGITLPPG